MTDRPSIFGKMSDLDLTDFAKPAATSSTTPSREAVAAVSQAAGFTSRAVDARALRGRHRTGRCQQINLKATPETIAAFTAFAAARGWSLAEAFEHALEALQKQKL